jgi:hypothetical protein
VRSLMTTWPAPRPRPRRPWSAASRGLVLLDRHPASRASSFSCGLASHPPPTWPLSSLSLIVTATANLASPEW